MSTTKYKFAVRFKLPVNIHDDKDHGHKMIIVCDMLDKMRLSYKTDEFKGVIENIYEIEDDHWDINLGTKTGNIYLDYQISESEFDFEGSINIKEIEKIRNKIPMGYRSDPDDIKVVAYGYYTGTDEPEVF